MQGLYGSYGDKPKTLESSREHVQPAYLSRDVTTPCLTLYTGLYAIVLANSTTAHCDRPTEMMAFHANDIMTLNMSKETRIGALHFPRVDGGAEKPVQLGLNALGTQCSAWILSGLVVGEIVCVCV